MANYSITNFISSPSGEVTMIKIYDKNSKLKYSLKPNVAYFSTKLNIVTIRVDDANHILLDFPNSTEAIKALAKLNEFKQFFNNQTKDTTILILNTVNKDMSALVTVNDGDLACITPILSEPKYLSNVTVSINGLSVNVGGKIYPFDCYFSSDGGITAKIPGSESAGDLLYWNITVANYNLDTNDVIDFFYLTIP